MIINDKILHKWKVYSAVQFREKFNILEKWDEFECDEDYIMRHLEKDKRLFRVTFMEDARGNQYDEYWKIKEIENETYQKNMMINQFRELIINSKSSLLLTFKNKLEDEIRQSKTLISKNVEIKK